MLTPEAIEQWRELIKADRPPEPGKEDFLDALDTTQALAERLARVEVCPTCPDSRVEAARLGYMAGHDDTVESRYGDPLEVAQDICQDLDDVEPTCPNCDDTRKAFKDWQAALRALGEGVCGLCGSDDDGCYCRYEAEPDTGEE